MNSDLPPRLSLCSLFWSLLGAKRTFVSVSGMTALGHKRTSVRFRFWSLTKAKTAKQQCF
jgi:hypothetical protein